MILSPQRDAIEALVPHLKPLELCEGQRFFLDRKEIFFRGISEGLSARPVEYQGINVAGFSAVPDGRPVLPEQNTLVAGAIFLRSAEADEFGDTTVEALDWQEIEPNQIHFVKTDKKQSYASIV